MKRLFITTYFLYQLITAFGQGTNIHLERATFPVTVGISQGPDTLRLDWTGGEAMIETYFNSIDLTQGFHQPRIFTGPSFVITFPITVPQGKRDSLIDEFEEWGAVLTHSCNCGTVEVWEFPNAIVDTLDDGTIRRPIGDEETWRHVRDRAFARDTTIKVAFNYPINRGLIPNQGRPWRIRFSSELDPIHPVKVAIIDFGIDGGHYDILPRLWLNPNVPADCFPDDFNGYRWFNGLEDNRATRDMIGHGTHIAGLFKQLFPQMPVQLMSLRIGGGGSSETRVFELACALRYAIDQQVDIINISLGYHGPKSRLLNTLMQEAREKGILVVTSAGNEGSNNDYFNHWPSNFPFDNLVAVGSYDRSLQKLAAFSNHGISTVHLAADGVAIYSALPGNNYGFKSGTSISAGFVTVVLAAILSDDPTLSYQAARQDLFTSPFVIQDSALIGLIQQERLLNIDPLDCGIDPEARTDWSAVKADSSVLLPVLTNDCYAAGMLPVLDNSFLPSNGSVSFNTNGQLLYVPNPVFTGKDTMRYVLCSNDSAGSCDTAFVYFDVKNPDSLFTHLVRHFDPQSVKLSPNPAKSLVQLKFVLEKAGQPELYLYNLAGQQLAEMPPHSLMTPGIQHILINLSDLPDGTYILMLKVRNQQYVMKLIIQH